MAKVIIKKDGTKLYPVCGFQRSQHKIYYWHTKAYNEFYDNPDDEKKAEEYEKWCEIIEWATCIYDGLIYMPYKYYNIVKEAIVAYDLRH